MHLRVGGDNGTQQRLRALDIDGEVIVDEKDGNLTVLVPGARFQSQKFINNALVCAKPNRVSEKAGHGAELAPVRTTAPRLDRNNAKRPPPPSYTPEQRARHLWNYIELVEVDRLPRDRRIWLERGLALLASLINWRVGILELAARGIINYLRPGFVGFPEGHSVGMPRPAASTKRLVGQFCHVRSAHHDRNSCGPNSIRHTIRLGYHSGHCADADESNPLFAHEPRDASFIHRLCVAINQQHLMARWSQRLEQKHPKMRHEIACHAVIGVVK